MVKVGTVYKSNGSLDISSLPFFTAIELVFESLIEDSYILNGNPAKMLLLKEEARRVRQSQYILAFLYHLEKGQLRTLNSMYFSYAIEDDELVRLALGGPQFYQYKKKFLEFNENLVELNVFTKKIVEIRRFE